MSSSSSTSTAHGCVSTPTEPLRRSAACVVPARDRPPIPPHRDAALGAALDGGHRGDPAAFLAGHAHAAYRRAGGTRDAVLPDFLIGAHAAVTSRPLLTRDPRRVATYMPGVTLVAPETPASRR
ncbi:MAG TPA: type II toxin-antitoxin system VapC family toxin [Solirubrobacteraceae bacterium]|nr:type II toxin-antitoxin system VapC family toxin [Solirubrobacteraceae bacterium]